MNYTRQAYKKEGEFLAHLKKAFRFDEYGAAGVYYDRGLRAVMKIAGNEVSFEFRDDIRAQPDKSAKS